MIHCSNVVKRDLFVQNKAYFTTLTVVFRHLFIFFILNTLILFPIKFPNQYHILVCKYRPGCTCLKQLQFTPYVQYFGHVNAQLLNEQGIQMKIFLLHQHAGHTRKALSER